MSSADHPQAWAVGWDGHQEQQLRRLARLPLVEKLRWLEETHYLVRHLSRTSLEPGGEESRVGPERHK